MHNENQGCQGGCHSSSNDCQSSGCSCPKKNSLGITITFEDGQTYACRLLAKFEINEQDYVVLEHPETTYQLLYRFTETDHHLALDPIEGKEFEIVAKTYQALSQ